MKDNRFSNMANSYLTTCKYNMYTKDTIKIDSTVFKIGDRNGCTIKRTVDYSAFGGMRDRFYAALIALYKNVLDKQKSLPDGYEVQNTSDFTNLVCMMFETDNDIERQEVSFDIYITTVGGDNSDIFSREDVKEVYFKYNTSKHIAVFNYGMIYTEIFNKLNLNNIIYHAKAFMIPQDSIKEISLPIDKDASMENIMMASHTYLADDTDTYSTYKYLIGLDEEETNNE